MGMKGALVRSPGWYGSAESLYHTPATNVILYVNYLELEF